MCSQSADSAPFAECSEGDQLAGLLTGQGLGRHAWMEGNQCPHARNSLLSPLGRHSLELKLFTGTPPWVAHPAKDLGQGCCWLWSHRPWPFGRHARAYVLMPCPVVGIIIEAFPENCSTPLCWAKYRPLRSCPISVESRQKEHFTHPALLCHLAYVSLVCHRDILDSSGESFTLKFPKSNLPRLVLKLLLQQFWNHKPVAPHCGHLLL